QQALQLWQRVGDQKSAATTLLGIGRVYDALGQKQEALNYYNQALPLWRAVGDRSGEATTLNNIGGVYDDLGQKQEALNYYNQALPLWRAVGDRSGEATTLNNIGYLLNGQKQPELAIVFYKQSVNVYESLRDANRSLPRDLQASFSKTFAYTYQNLADLLIKQGRLPEAQAVLELLQLKDLREYTRDAKLQTPGISLTPEEQQAFDQILKEYTTFNQLATQITSCEANPKAAGCDQLPQLYRQRDQINAAVERELDRLRATLAQQAIDPSQLNTEELNQAARAIVTAQPGTIFIYPILQEKKIQFFLAFQAGDGALSFKPVAGVNVDSETLFTTANKLRDLLRSPDSDLKQLQATSKQLYDWLIKPLEPEINQKTVKHLVFASNKATRYIPLGALYDGKDYLINKPYTLSIVLSASTTDPEADRPATPNILAAGATTFASADPLPYVGQEIDAIVKTQDHPEGVFPGRALLDQAFDFASLQANLKGFNFLHIATHGILDPGNIDNSVLLPGKGELIDKTKIRSLRNYGLGNIHLVVLSACNTAVGTSAATGSDPTGQRLELSGISYYFMQDGAKAVLASLWAVGDPSTALLMQRFYFYLAQGQSKNQALRQAQRDLLQLKDKAAAQQALTALPRGPGVRPLLPPPRAGAPGYTHPFYWAPFILIGNGK
ncbi:MAG TPA: CHAT domain-containing protein, partial [Coleofasciculaceae cyanobacterium]